MEYCTDPRHDTPCPLPCDACDAECDDGRCHECNAMLELWGDRLVCPQCKARQELGY